MKASLDSIESAIAAIRDGQIVIVVDDENRENEGDFVAAASKVTPEMINFMATHGRGLICTPLLEKDCDRLGLNMMVSNNTDPHGTAFTESIDLKGNGNTTGISAHDRSRTIQAMLDPVAVPNSFGRPGHIFPLKAKDGGVLRRTGHTEAAVDLARLAGMHPAGVIVEIMNEDGSMARLPQLFEIADKFNLKLISIEDLIAYRMENESLIEKINAVELAGANGQIRLNSYRQTTTGAIHLALVKGDIKETEPVPVRVHSSLLIGDLFQSTPLNTGPHLNAALAQIQHYGKGVVVFISPRDAGVLPDSEEHLDQLNEKLLSRKMDPLDYGIGAQILREIGVGKMQLMSNNPTKRTGIIGYGLEVVETIPMPLNN